MPKRGKATIRFFTTVELLAVMGILAVLMAMGIGVYSFASFRMAEAKTRGIIRKIEVALGNYKAQEGYYIQQSTTSGFYIDQYDDAFKKFIDYESMINKDTEDTTNGRAVIDGFGNQIKYRCPGTHNRSTFDIWSDGNDSTTTEDDINNWK